MTHVLVTVSGGIINRVTFFDCRPKALRALASFVKEMDPEEQDAAVFGPKGLVANAKNFLDETDHFIEGSTLTDGWVSDKESSNSIYLIGNPVHRLGFMVASPDDPLGFETQPKPFLSGSNEKGCREPPEALSSHSSGRTITTRVELEQCNAENGVEDFAFPLVEEYVMG